MDLTLDDDQTAIAELAGRILTDTLAPGRVRELEAEPDWFAGDTWRELARADLLGVCLPEVDDGGGYGIEEACLMLEQVGRTVAPVPLFATLVLGAMPIAQFGTDEQRAVYLPSVIAGDLVLSAALVEPGWPEPPAVPATVATPDGDGWRLVGEKVFVPSGHLAGQVLVPARTGETVTTVFLVDAAADGVGLEHQVATNLEPLPTLRMDGVAVGPGDVLGEIDEGTAVVAWITERAVAGLCATSAGVCEAALRITATYTSERHQFNAPIATFQAVAQRMADAYIDTEAVRLTARQAAWLLARGEPAAEALAVAKVWAAEGGQRVAHAALHLHGGIGVDVDYPVHRHFRWAKHLELSLGGATHHLLKLGARLADAPV